VLELRNVSNHFSDIPAVEDVSFFARPGEVTGYLGPNRSGKSTTMKMQIISGTPLMQRRDVRIRGTCGLTR
jgi:ABC-type multidrug transport system ATPase subunit